MNGDRQGIVQSKALRPGLRRGFAAVDSQSFALRNPTFSESRVTNPASRVPRPEFHKEQRAAKVGRSAAWMAGTALLTSLLDIEKSGVRLLLGGALNQEGELAGVIVAPHG